MSRTKQSKATTNHPTNPQSQVSTPPVSVGAQPPDANPRTSGRQKTKTKRVRENDENEEDIQQEKNKKQRKSSENKQKKTAKDKRAAEVAARDSNASQPPPHPATNVDTNTSPNVPNDHQDENLRIIARLQQELADQRGKSS